MNRRRDTQKRYRQKNPGDQEARRYRAAISEAKSGSEVGISIGGKASLVWDEIKDEIEPQLFVTLIFLARLVVSVVRDERLAQPFVISKDMGG